MSRRRHFSQFEAEVGDLSHDGRGVARRDGKAVFIAGALRGERVRAQETARRRSFDEARTVEVLQPSPQRVAPRCEHFGTCSGCVLQHLEAGRQIEAKEHALLDALQRIGQVTPDTVLAPLTGPGWGYRRKGRLSVRRVEKKGRTLVGFRETDPRFVADIRRCAVAVPEIGVRIGELAELVDGLEARSAIPQIEFVAGDAITALVFRHLVPLGEPDTDALAAYAQRTGLAIYLQPGGVESVRLLWPRDVRLSYRIPDQHVELEFGPLDFIQVNAAINNAMVERAVQWLDPGPSERVLDLFCGLGNFSLPLARRGGHVVGVEGDEGLVSRARSNARLNGISNAEFHAADLTLDHAQAPWFQQGFDKLLLDPPRSGAAEVLSRLPLERIKRIVYVSCHPGSLARDAGHLVREHGFRLAAAGVMDMFPHTAHVESIAVFDR